MKSLKTLWKAYCLTCGIGILAWLTYNWWDDPLRNSLSENGYKEAAMKLPEYEEKDLVRSLEKENTNQKTDSSISSDLCGERKCFSSIQNGLTCALIQDIVFFEARKGQVLINLTGSVPDSYIKNSLTEVSAEMTITNEHLFFKTRSYLINLLQVGRLAHLVAHLVQVH